MNAWISFDEIKSDVYFHYRWIEKYDLDIIHECTDDILIRWIKNCCNPDAVIVKNIHT